MDETRVFLMDDEYELRPISAQSVLESKQESRNLREVYGAEREDMPLIAGACLLAHGIYLNGEKVFSSGAAVLEKMTADEILAVAGEYTHGKSEMPERFESEHKGLITASPQTRGTDVESAKTNAESPENVSADTDIISETYPEDNGTKPVHFLENSDETKARKKRRQPDENAGVQFVKSRFSDVAENREPYYELQNPQPTFMHNNRNRMLEISDFFERDNRRYDGAFIRY